MGQTSVEHRGQDLPGEFIEINSTPIHSRFQSLELDRSVIPDQATPSTRLTVLTV